MTLTYQLQQFTGPLDLLLNLIEDKKLPITEVSLSEVTGQFMQYLSQIDERHPEELADFLVVATRLLLLKSQALLPYLKVEEEEDPGQLTRQLKIFKKYLDAMRQVEQRLAERPFLYPRKESMLQMMGVQFSPPTVMNAGLLRTVFQEVLALLAPVVRIPKAAIEKVVSLRDKICRIEGLLEKEATVSFQKLVKESKSRTDVVMTFLALLELVKQQVICVKQEKAFADIWIEKV